MGNTINAALRDPQAVALVDAVLPYNNLHVRDIEAYWRSFYDHAESFALTRAQLRVICTKAASFLDPHRSSKRAIHQADAVFDVFVPKDIVSDAPVVIDALEFLSAMVFIASISIEDKIDLIFDSWDMSEDGELDLDELTISLKSTLSGIAKVLKIGGGDRKSTSTGASTLDDDEIEVLAERVFRDIAKLPATSTSLNQVTVNCNQFRAYCMENKSARALFDALDRVDVVVMENQLDDDQDIDNDYDAMDDRSKPNPVGPDAPSHGNTPDKALGNALLTNMTDQGDEFLAVKPWKGAIVPPSKIPSINKAAPVVSITLEWIFGYNAHDSKNNVRYCVNQPDEIVYPAAGACVVLNTKTRSQRHYFGHSDDVISISVHHKRAIVASGEIGKKPKVIVWNSVSMETLCVLQGFHQRAVTLLTFCGDSTLISVGGDDDHSVAVYETCDGWKSAALKSISKGNKATPHHLCAYAGGPTVDFVCCGDKFIDFWTYDGKILTHKKGILGNMGSLQAFLVADFMGSPGSLVVGTNDGSLYFFTGRDLTSVVKATLGAVQSMHFQSGTLAVGTKNGHITLYDDKLKQIGGPFCVKDFAISGTSSGVRSCSTSFNKKSILVGTAASEIYEIDSKTGKDTRGGALASGHFLGELWGLDVHPQKTQFCTVGDDRTLRVWDLEKKREIRSVVLDMPGRTCAYSADGRMIAVGLGADGSNSGRGLRNTSRAKLPSGGFIVFSECDLSIVRDPCFEPKKWVSDIKFSPDDRVLAVASHDTTVYLYDALKGFSKKQAFKKHTSYVNHIDFSTDGQHLQSTCGGYELLFSDVKTGRHITNASSLRDERWHTMTCTLGWSVQGIWEECSDGTDVNAADRSRDGTLLATGDDFGKVKIFRYPCAVEKASYVELRGHSSHVTKVKWSYQDKWIVSTGGNDRCVFVWRNENASGGGSRDLAAAAKQRVGNEDQPVVELKTLCEVDSTTEFDDIEDDVGDEFMAIKPWLGAIVAPTDAKNMKLDSSSPDARLELERVHGYQAQNASNNARYDSQGKIVYHAAALGIVYDKASQKQSFFKFHDDDVVALCMHPNGSTVATAQMGKKPKIYTWSSANPSSAISLLEGFHERVVCAICFSSDGKKLGSIGGDDDHSIAIYSWENGLLSASAKGERGYVRAICYHEGQWISCGEKHVRFWREQGKHLSSKKAIFGKAKHKDNKMPGVFEAVVSFGTWVVVGGSNGDLYLFQGSNELARVVTAHSASTFALFATASGELVSGGKDGTIMVWDASVANIFKFDLKEHASTLRIYNASIRSICPAPRSSRTFLIGTHGSDLIEIDTNRSSSITGSTTWIARGHSELEVWGLATHPTRPEYCSVGDDQLLQVWSLQKKELLRQQKLEAMARTCTIFASGKIEVIAIGLGGRHAGASSRNTKAQTKTGSVVIVEYSDLYKKVFEDKPSKQPISEVKFSPSGTVLAVGSHDNNIYLYKIQDTTFKTIVKSGMFSKHHSYITHFDFSADGRFLQSNCGAYELLFSDTESAKQITSASSTKDVKWDTWTCVLGWPVQGIWPPCSDGTDVNAADRNRRGDLLVTSDDFGLVKLYRYPCVTKNASAVEYRGHSSHVTNVRWSAGDSHVVSTGGNDRCIMEWKLAREDEGWISAEEKPVETQTDGSEDDESFDDEGEGDEFMAVKPWIGAIVPPSNAPTPNTRIPDLHMELDWVYGYHTELSKRNLVYNSHGEIVYHTAAVGVIYDQKNHLQKHHVCHNDDITSFAITIKRDVVATGERGKKPVIRIWDAHTGELRCELKGFHSRGIVSLAFAPDAKKLVSVGDDDDHSVAMWEDKSHGSWTSGVLIATARGDKGIHRFSCFGRDDNTVVTGGVKHVLFWRVEGKAMVAKKGKVGKTGTLQNFPSGCVFGGDVVTGTASGELYVWTGDSLSKVVKAHDGESTVVTTQDVPSSERQLTSTQVLLSGGRDGKVAMWSSTYQALKTIDVGSLCPGCLNKSVASAFLSITGQTLLIGTCSSDILEFDMSTGTVLHGGRPLLSGHFALELWGLATHPSQRQFSTVGDDGTLRTWDMDARKLVSMTKLATKARACAYSPDGAMLAIGYGGDNGVRRKGKPKSVSKDGAIVVISAQGDSKTLFEDRPAKEWISDIKFSPCGNLLAVGSHDNAIYLYAVNDSFKKRKPFQKHSSYITHFDFSKDSKYLQSNCGAYELLFCKTTSSEQICSASSLKDTAWHTWTCTLGWPVQGIWPECADGTDINSVCASSSRTLLATGDDSSKVKIFRYPCTLKGSKFLEMRGHASHVTNVRFSHDDKFLISTGGNDRSIFQWKLS